MQAWDEQCAYKCGIFGTTTLAAFPDTTRPQILNVCLMHYFYFPGNKRRKPEKFRVLAAGFDQYSDTRVRIPRYFNCILGSGTDLPVDAHLHPLAEQLLRELVVLLLLAGVLVALRPLDVVVVVVLSQDGDEGGERVHGVQGCQVVHQLCVRIDLFL